METFKGLSLEPADAFHNIAVMIEVGTLLSVVDIDESSDNADCVFSVARQYALAAQAYAEEES